MHRNTLGSWLNSALALHCQAHLQRPKLPEPASGGGGTGRDGTGALRAGLGFEHHVQPPPPVSGKVLPGTAPPRAGCPLGANMELAVAAWWTHVPAPPQPAPAQDGPGAAPCARRRRPQNCALRLGRRAAVAPLLRARRLPPGSLRVGQSVVPTLPLRSLLPFLPRAPLGVPGTASGSSLPAARVSFPRGGGGRGGGGGAGTSSAPSALVQLGRPSSPPCRASGRPAPPPLLASLRGGRGALRVPAAPAPRSRASAPGAGSSGELLPRRP